MAEGTIIRSGSLFGVARSRNLLHNWDFRPGGIVNQRNLTSYSGGTGTAFAACVDRWVISNISASVTSEGLQITGVSGGDPYLAQRIRTAGAEFQLAQILGKTFTFSAMVGGVTYSVTVSLPSTLPSVTTKYGTLSTPFGSISLNLSPSTAFWCDVYVTVGTTITIQATKLEYGLVSTSANDSPMYDGEELAKCQRFLFTLDGYNRFRCVYVETNTLSFWIPTPVTLRANPTFTGTEIGVITLTGAAQTGFSFQYIIRGAGILVIATKTSHGMTDASLSIVDGKFSAEL